MPLKMYTHALVGSSASVVLVALVGSHPAASIYLQTRGVGVLEAAAVGAFFGVLPDMDIILHGAGAMRHRGPLSHSLLASILISLAALILLPFVPRGLPVHPGSWIPAVAFLASFLHSAVDSLTPSGTLLFYPLSRKRFRGGVRYDSIWANVLISAVALALAALIGTPTSF
ncbi:MAG: metal-dependent hydrolase [Thermoplasmata archaeon]|nr:metal-dependent hydrolase [Thermoplasmata archaeon]